MQTKRTVLIDATVPDTSMHILDVCDTDCIVVDTPIQTGQYSSSRYSMHSTVEVFTAQTGVCAVNTSTVLGRVCLSGRTVCAESQESSGKLQGGTLRQKPDKNHALSF